MKLRFYYIKIMIAYLNKSNTHLKRLVHIFVINQLLIYQQLLLNINYIINRLKFCAE
jgi:hypothetical protein